MRNRRRIGAKDSLRAPRAPATISAGGGWHSPPWVGTCAEGVSAPTLPRPLEVGRIGEVVLRADGVPKVKGEFAYSSDLVAPGMLWGHTVRSPHAHARILAIDVADAAELELRDGRLAHDAASRTASKILA